jgi:hippurate hydrolase
MAASDALTVTIRGRGGHAASPLTARDPIPAACEMVLALREAVPPRISPASTAILTVGSLHAGSGRNTIPETATFEATVRTFDRRVGERIREIVERIRTDVGRAHDVRVEVDYVPEYPVTVNDPTETRFALATAGAVVGTDRIVHLPEPVTGSEDFSRVLAEVPGAMLFLGAMPEGMDPDQAPANHSPRAVFDDSVLPVGAALLATWALNRLADPGTTPR